MSHRPAIESAVIITLSTVHLGRATIDLIERHRGDIPEGPSIACRDEGYLLSSHLGMPEALDLDLRPGLHRPFAERFPDLVLIRSFARGLGAEWINLDTDGVTYSDVLPHYSYDRLEMPSDPAWARLLAGEVLPCGRLLPGVQALRDLEAGRWPTEEAVPAP